jgi:hypothetical protein
LFGKHRTHSCSQIVPKFRARDLRLDKLPRIIMQLRPPQADFGDLSIWRVPIGSG